MAVAWLPGTELPSPQVRKCTRTTCYYEVLGIARGANDDEIKRACVAPWLLPFAIFGFHRKCSDMILVEFGVSHGVVNSVHSIRRPEAGAQAASRQMHSEGRRRGV